MSRSTVSGREVARRVLRRVEGGSYASLALGGELARAGELAAAERRLATEIVYGVTRQRARLDRALGALAKRGIGKLQPGVRAALRAGAYQILFLDRVPDHAAVNDAVSAARKLGGPKVGGFVNGVLRSLVREGEPALPDPALKPRAYAEQACSLPGWIAARLEAAVGEGELAQAAEAFAKPAPLAARVNTLRKAAPEGHDALCAEGAGVADVAICPGALAVTGLGDPDASPSFRAGLWTVQDAAAQLVAHLLAPEPGARILDACAGVGGKSTHLAQLTGGRAPIDAADASARKLDLARATSRRLGVAEAIRAVQVDLTAPGDRLAEAYEAILLDAPCTGLGVMRRHPESKWRVTEAEVAKMSALQRALLDALVDRLAPGGVLVYSVCTFTAEEGPEQIAGLLRAHPELQVEVPATRPGAPPWRDLLEADGSLRTFPHRHGADAFYAIRLRRAHSS
jgi:16S rRNA (cytosine967-C5)-methyltransferase